MKHQLYADVIYEFLVNKWVNDPKLVSGDEKAMPFMKVLMAIFEKPFLPGCYLVDECNSTWQDMADDTVWCLETQEDKDNKTGNVPSAIKKCSYRWAEALH